MPFKFLPPLEKTHILGHYEKHCVDLGDVFVQQSRIIIFVQTQFVWQEEVAARTLIWQRINNNEENVDFLLLHISNLHIYVSQRKSILAIWIFKVNRSERKNVSM